MRLAILVQAVSTAISAVGAVAVQRVSSLFVGTAVLLAIAALSSSMLLLLLLLPPRRGSRSTTVLELRVLLLGSALELLGLDGLQMLAIVADCHTGCLMLLLLLLEHCKVLLLRVLLLLLLSLVLEVTARTSGRPRHWTVGSLYPASSSQPTCAYSALPAVRPLAAVSHTQPCSTLKCWLESDSSPIELALSLEAFGSLGSRGKEIHRKYMH